jgi:protein gp37
MAAAHWRGRRHHRLGTAGGESGPNARPVALDWVRALRDQCARSATPFYWNGWGALMPDGQTAENTTPEAAKRYLDGALREALPRGA